MLHAQGACFSFALLFAGVCVAVLRSSVLLLLWMKLTLLQKNLEGLGRQERDGSQSCCTSFGRHQTLTMTGVRAGWSRLVAPIQPQSKHPMVLRYSMVQQPFIHPLHPFTFTSLHCSFAIDIY